jgi:ectoine hydroxylase-related dioxygenase (phytanoyl-CoA dioxygenase family)
VHQHSCRTPVIGMWHRSVEEQGFAIVPAVLTKPDISKLERDLVHAGVHRSRAGTRHVLKHSAVSELASDDRLLGIAQQVLGSDAVPFRATLFDKSPHSNWLVMWHQDTALPLRHRRETSGWGPWSIKDGVTYAHAPAPALGEVLALRIHLDDSTADNGPLRVLPGTHKMGVLDDDEIHKLAEHLTSQDCLVPKGGILAMRPLIVHASSKSRSQTARRVLHLEYAACCTIDGLQLAMV